MASLEELKVLGRWHTGCFGHPVLLLFQSSRHLEINHVDSATVKCKCMREYREQKVDKRDKKLQKIRCRIVMRVKNCEGGEVPARDGGCT